LAVTLQLQSPVTIGNESQLHPPDQEKDPDDNLISRGTASTKKLVPTAPNVDDKPKQFQLVDLTAPHPPPKALKSNQAGTSNPFTITTPQNRLRRGGEDEESPFRTPSDPNRRISEFEKLLLSVRSKPKEFGSPVQTHVAPARKRRCRGRRFDSKAKIEETSRTVKDEFLGVVERETVVDNSPCP